MNTPATPDWEKGIIPQYSKIAVVNEDRVDGYEMIPATDFIRNLRLQYQKELVENLRLRIDRLTNGGGSIYSIPQLERGEIMAYENVIALLKDN